MTTLEEFKKQVETCLIEHDNYTVAAAKDLVKYADEILNWCYENSWTPETVAIALVMNYL